MRWAHPDSLDGKQGHAARMICGRLVQVGNGKVGIADDVHSEEAVAGAERVKGRIEPVEHVEHLAGLEPAAQVRVPDHCRAEGRGCGSGPRAAEEAQEHSSIPPMVCFFPPQRTERARERRGGGPQADAGSSPSEKNSVQHSWLSGSTLMPALSLSAILKGRPGGL